MAQHTMTQGAQGRPADPVESHLRVIKNWVVFMGIVTLLGLVAAVIGGISLGVHLSQIQQNQQTSSAVCQSQGGTVPGC
jgi:hypothetical protein